MRFRCVHFGVPLPFEKLFYKKNERRMNLISKTVYIMITVAFSAFS